MFHFIRAGGAARLRSPAHARPDCLGPRRVPLCHWRPQSAPSPPPPRRKTDGSRRHSLSIAHWLSLPGRMRPANAAANWKLPAIGTIGNLDPPLRSRVVCRPQARHLRARPPQTPPLRRSTSAETLRRCAPARNSQTRVEGPSAPHPFRYSRSRPHTSGDPRRRRGPPARKRNCSTRPPSPADKSAAEFLAPRRASLSRRSIRTRPPFRGSAPVPPAARMAADRSALPARPETPPPPRR